MTARLIGIAAALAVTLTACTPATQPSPGAPSDPASPSASPSRPAQTTAPEPLSYPFSFDTLPRFDGSTANIPLISLVIQRLTGASAAEADNAVRVTTTPNAYRALIAGETDLLLVYEANATVNQEVADSGVKLESHPIGRDALVFFTNEANPVASLTTKELRDVYTGRITNWKQVGGDDVDIVAYQRTEESGSQALMRKYVMGDRKMAKAPSELVTDEMGGIIEGVSDYANTGNALGYSVYYYLANMYAVEGIRMLGIGNVLPSHETIGAEEYPYVNDFFVIIRADEPAGSPARRVMEWLLSVEGTQTVVDAGYVPAG
ncbi:MAG: substrate-binding domain-containing protein [Propionibacteriaceae bacterium]|nr:substrate-binding domain-containing protein [Propionibacteriaceae bacterium]